MNKQSTPVAPYRQATTKTSAKAVTPESTGRSFGVSDIAYIFYRHKKKVIICSILGIVGASVVGFKYKPESVSDSKLMIRYVVDARRGTPSDSNDQIRNPDSRGDNIINSEVELITSLDLAIAVAEKVGATNILTGVVDSDVSQLDPVSANQAAAVVIRNRLEVRVKPKSNVIGVSFQHPNREVARRVLSALIGTEAGSGGSTERVAGEYIKAHARVHRALGLLKDLEAQKADKFSKLQSAESELRSKKESLRIVSVPEARKNYADSLSRLRSQRNEAEQMLNEGLAAYQRMTNSLALANVEAPRPIAPPPQETPEVKTNETVQAEAPVIPVPSAETILAFRGINERLEVLRQREQALLLQFLPTSIYVRRISDQLAESLKERQKLIETNPGLTNTPAASAPSQAGDRVPVAPLQQQQQPSQSPQNRNAIDIVAETAKVEALAARLKTITEQLQKEEAAALEFAKQEPRITQLERDVQTYEKQYNYFLTAADEAGVDDAVLSSRISNISVLQYPSPAYPATGALVKLLCGTVFGGIGLGLGLAFLIEFVTDRSIRRPKQVIDNLNVPLFLSVPVLDLPKPGAATQPPGSPPSAGGEGSDQEELGRFAEALRDRLIMQFQIRDVTHKPKLIGVTSCGRGAGVTTLATSLAASLSETGEGNVLYVDVNSQMKASAAPFRKGKPVVGITEALGETGRDAAQVGENLYMVSLSDPSSNKVGVIPKKLANLVPKIRESNYDYIIFDLPPVTQTSVAARVSGLLDTTVMVLESEKTQSELARQAVKLLGESNTELVAVLNKHKKYLPESLETDL